MLDNLIFISAQPYDNYFVWQIEVQIVNFRKLGVSNKMHILVWYPRGEKSRLKNWHLLQEKYKEVTICFYEDGGINESLYIPQLRPHILKFHFYKYEDQLKDKVFFYHDADIIFNRLPDFETLLKYNICWQSNTTSYLDYSYIQNKERQGNIKDKEAINTFCKIGEITEDILIKYNGITGGAQSILKDIDYKFWIDVENKSIEIRKLFSYHIKGSINNRYFNSEDDGFQSWCADMWALNFSLWKRGIETNTTTELDFSWATDSIERCRLLPIYHNAGAEKNDKGVFYKGDWINESPIGKSIIVDSNSASSFYVKAINEVPL